MADVVLDLAKRTRDGRQMFEVIQVAQVPPEVTDSGKGDKHNTSMTEKDDHGVLRPVRKWLFDLYGSVGDRSRMR